MRNLDQERSHKPYNPQERTVADRFEGREYRSRKLNPDAGGVVTVQAREHARIGGLLKGYLRDFQDYEGVRNNLRDAEALYEAHPDYELFEGLRQTGNPRMNDALYAPVRTLYEQTGRFRQDLDQHPQRDEARERLGQIADVAAAHYHRGTINERAQIEETLRNAPDADLTSQVFGRVARREIETELPVGTRQRTVFDRITNGFTDRMLYVFWRYWWKRTAEMYINREPIREIRSVAGVVASVDTLGSFSDVPKDQDVVQAVKTLSPAEAATLADLVKDGYAENAVALARLDLFNIDDEKAQEYARLVDEAIKYGSRKLSPEDQQRLQLYKAFRVAYQEHRSAINSGASPKFDGKNVLSLKQLLDITEMTAWEAPGDMQNVKVGMVMSKVMQVMREGYDRNGQTVYARSLTECFTAVHEMINRERGWNVGPLDPNKDEVAFIAYRMIKMMADLPVDALSADTQSVKYRNTVSLIKDLTGDMSNLKGVVFSERYTRRAEQELRRGIVLYVRDPLEDKHVYVVQPWESNKLVVRDTPDPTDTIVYEYDKLGYAMGGIAQGNGVATAYDIWEQPREVKQAALAGFFSWELMYPTSSNIKMIDGELDRIARLPKPNYEAEVSTLYAKANTSTASEGVFYALSKVFEHGHRTWFNSVRQKSLNRNEVPVDINKATAEMNIDIIHRVVENLRCRVTNVLMSVRERSDRENVRVVANRLLGLNKDHEIWRDTDSNTVIDVSSFVEFPLLEALLRKSAVFRSMDMNDVLDDFFAYAGIERKSVGGREILIAAKSPEDLAEINFRTNVGGFDFATELTNLLNGEMGMGATPVAPDETTRRIGMTRAEQEELLMRKAIDALCEYGNYRSGGRTYDSFMEDASDRLGLVVQTWSNYLLRDRHIRFSLLGQNFDWRIGFGDHGSMARLLGRTYMSGPFLFDIAAAYNQRQEIFHRMTNGLAMDPDDREKEREILRQMFRTYKVQWDDETQSYKALRPPRKNAAGYLDPARVARFNDAPEAILNITGERYVLVEDLLNDGLELRHTYVRSDLLTSTRRIEAENGWERPLVACYDPQMLLWQFAAKYLPTTVFNQQLDKARHIYDGPNGRGAEAFDQLSRQDQYRYVARYCIESGAIRHAANADEIREFAMSVYDYIGPDVYYQFLANTGCDGRIYYYERYGTEKKVGPIGVETARKEAIGVPDLSLPEKQQLGVREERARKKLIDIVKGGGRVLPIGWGLVVGVLNEVGLDVRQLAMVATQGTFWYTAANYALSRVDVLSQLNVGWINPVTVSGFVGLYAASHWLEWVGEREWNYWFKMRNYFAEQVLKGWGVWDSGGGMPKQLLDNKSNDSFVATADKLLTGHQEYAGGAGAAGK